MDPVLTSDFGPQNSKQKLIKPVAPTANYEYTALSVADNGVGGGELVWPNSTRPGDVLPVGGEVIEFKSSRSHPDRGMVTVLSDTRNQRGEIVQTLTAKLIVPRRPTAEGA